MTPDLRNSIVAELTAFLGRPPMDQEVENGQTDINIIGKIREKELLDIKSKLKL